MTIADALRNPDSNLNRQIDKARKTMNANEKIIAAWMAKGLTREQAWAKALAR